MKATHYHQNLEILYVLKGEMEIQINDAAYCLKNGDFILVNANKSHSISVTKEMFGARFVTDFRLLAEAMGTMQLLFWCNTTADKNDAYKDLRGMLDQILERYFEKEDRSSLHLQSLYYETLHLLTSNFLVKADDVRINLENSQDRIRVRQIQNYMIRHFSRIYQGILGYSTGKPPASTGSGAKCLRRKKRRLRKKWKRTGKLYSGT